MAITFAGSFFVALGTAALATALDTGQRPLPSTPEKATVGLTISLQVGSERYDFTGRGKCDHAARASIYNTPAESWGVEQSGDNRSAMLTVWKPTANGSETMMMSLNLSAAGKSYVVDTVKGGSKSKTKGSGSIAFEAAGQGGTFTLNAATASGANISGTVKCDAFVTREAVSGH